MKKKKLKLSLNKMTVAKINDVSAVKGGESGPVTAPRPSVEYCPTVEQCMSPHPCAFTIDCETLYLHTQCVG